MKAASFDYKRPDDVSGAVKELGDGQAKPFGGGQSLGPMLNLRLARPKAIVDVSRLEAMRKIEDKGAHWRFGGAVTHSMIEDAKLPGGEPMNDVARGIAYRTIRNRGTIGGSMAHADPAADWPLALPALGATLVLQGKGGERKVPAAQFMKAAFSTALADDELIVAVEVPKLSSAGRWGYWKFCRKTGEFPEASCAVLMDRERKVAEVWVGALNGAPQPLPQFAADLAQRGIVAATTEAVAMAVETVAEGLDPAQRALHATAVRRAVQKALS